MPRFAGTPVDTEAAPPAAPPRGPRFRGVPIDTPERPVSGMNVAPDGTVVGDYGLSALIASGAATMPPRSPSPPSWKDTAADVGLSAGAGLVRGAAGLVGLPGTIDDMATGGVDYLVRKGVGAVTGEEPAPLSSMPGYRPNPLSGDALLGAIERAAGPLHRPETTAGEFGRTIGEFAPGAMIGPGRAAAKIGGDWLMPAVASEAAGQATEGTALEEPARLVGALAGNAPATVARMRAAGADRAVGAAVGGVTPGEFGAARQLQERAAAIGVPLSGPEAIQAATGGATRLGDLQRVVEGSTGGGTTLARFYADRPERVAAAADRAFDTIAPATASPSMLGPRAADAATAAIRDVERARTAAVDPLFRAAAGDSVPVDAMRALLGEIDATVAADRTGILAAPLRELRGRLIAGPARPGSPAVRTPVTGPDGRVIRYTTTPAVDATPAVPVTDLKNLNRLRKYFRDRLDLPQVGQDAITKEQGAAITAVLARLDDLMSAASPSYRSGNAEFARLSDEIVNPIAAGPLGRVAASGDTAAAIRAVLPDRPHTGGADEFVDTITRLGTADAGLPPALVRQGLADRFDQSAGRLVGGANPYGGARFAKDVAGTTQQDENLRAIIAALNNPPAAEAMANVLDVFRATGARKPQGSATAFNQQIAAELGQLPAVATAVAGMKSAGMAAAREIGDVAQRAWLGRSTASLADLFVSPDSVVQIRDAAGRPVRSPVLEWIMRGAVQSAGQ